MEQINHKYMLLMTEKEAIDIHNMLNKYAHGEPATAEEIRRIGNIIEDIDYALDGY